MLLNQGVLDLSLLGTNLDIQSAADHYSIHPFRPMAYDDEGVYVPGTNQTLIFSTANPGMETLMVRIFNHTTKLWSGPHPVSWSQIFDNDHGGAAPVVLSDGRVLVFFGSHSTDFPNQQWAISNGTDFTDWTLLPDITGRQHTYPKPINVPNGNGGGTIYLFFRQTNAGDMPFMYYTITYTANGTPTVNGGASFLIAELDRRVYAGSPFEYQEIGGQGFVLFFWTTSNQNDSFRRHIYGARFKISDGSLENIAGTFSVASGSLPISEATANAQFCIVDQGTDQTQIPSWAVDSSGTIHLVYSTSAGTADGETITFQYINNSGGQSATWSTPEALGTGIDLDATGNFSGFKTQSINIHSSTQGGQDFQEVYYHQGLTHGDIVGGDKIVRRRRIGGVWLAPEDLVEREGDAALIGIGTVKDGLNELRFMFAEGSLSDLTHSARALYRQYFVGVNLPSIPDPENRQYLVEHVDYVQGLKDLSQGATPWSLIGNAAIVGGRLETDGNGDRVQAWVGIGDANWRFRQNRKYNLDANFPFTLDIYGLQLDTLSQQGHVWGNMGNNGSRGYALVVNPSASQLALQLATSQFAVTTFTASGISYATGTDYFIRVCRTASGDLRFFLAAGSGQAVMEFKQTGVTALYAASFSTSPVHHMGRSSSTGADLDGRLRGAKFWAGVSLSETDDAFTPPLIAA